MLSIICAHGLEVLDQEKVGKDKRHVPALCSLMKKQKRWSSLLIVGLAHESILSGLERAEVWDLQSF